MKSISWISILFMLCLLMVIADDITGFADRVHLAQRFVHDAFQFVMVAVTFAFIRRNHDQR